MTAFIPAAYFARVDFGESFTANLDAAVDFPAPNWAQKLAAVGFAFLLTGLGVIYLQ
jgi:hypothetical protein